MGCLALVVSACGDRTGLLLPVSMDGPDADTDSMPMSEAGPGSPDGTTGDDDSPDEQTRDDSSGIEAGCPSPECDDGIACTKDECDIATRTCLHTPQNGLCPVGFVCDLALGCSAGAYASSGATLYTANLPSASIQNVGSTSLTGTGTSIDLFDLALAPDGTLYGVDATSVLYTIDTSTGEVTPIPVHPYLGATLNALDAAPDGTLYAAGLNLLYAYDLSSHTLNQLATYPPGLASSGDLASLGGKLFATANNGQAMSNDVLLVIDLATLSMTVLGSTGFPCIYGLAAQGTSLFGFTCNGQVLSLDTTSGQGTLLGTPGQAFFGASAR
jgi:hypothetical protein